MGTKQRRRRKARLSRLIVRCSKGEFVLMICIETFGEGGGGPCDSYKSPLPLIRSFKSGRFEIEAVKPGDSTGKRSGPIRPGRSLILLRRIYGLCSRRLFLFF